MNNVFHLTSSCNFVFACARMASMPRMKLACVYSEPKFPRDSLLAAYFSSEHRTREPRDPSGHHGWSVGRGCTVPEQPTGRRARDEVDSIFAVNPRPLKCKSETRIAHLTSDRGVDSSGMRWLASRTKALARFFRPAHPLIAASWSSCSAASYITSIDACAPVSVSCTAAI